MVDVMATKQSPKQSHKPGCHTRVEWPSVTPLLRVEVVHTEDVHIARSLTDIYPILPKKLEVDS